MGDQTPIKINVRVISATRRDLQQLVEKEEFRDDLFYRLNVIPINIPPLRERKEDLPLLVETFISELQVKTDKPIKGISREAMEAMWAYTWPGNIRELINALEYAFVTCSGVVIDISNLPDAVLPSEGMKVPRPPLGEDDHVKMQLLAALKQANGEKNKAAEILGISRQTLWKRIRKYGIEVKKTITSQ